MKFLNRFNWFNKLPSEDFIFDVKNFDKWFDESGIFLELGKLSENHIYEYLKSYDKKVCKKYSDKKYHYLVYAFYTQVEYYWRVVLKKK